MIIKENIKGLDVWFTIDQLVTPDPGVFGKLRAESKWMVYFNFNEPGLFSGVLIRDSNGVPEFWDSVDEAKAGGVHYVESL